MTFVVIPAFAGIHANHICLFTYDLRIRSAPVIPAKAGIHAYQAWHLQNGLPRNVAPTLTLLHIRGGGDNFLVIPAKAGRWIHI